MALAGLMRATAIPVFNVDVAVIGGRNSRALSAAGPSNPYDAATSRGLVPRPAGALPRLGVQGRTVELWADDRGANLKPVNLELRGRRYNNSVTHLEAVLAIECSRAVAHNLSKVRVLAGEGHDTQFAPSAEGGTLNQPVNPGHR